MKLGQVIVEHRKSLHYSQQQLADKISVSRSAVAKWESNKGIPDIENMKSLSKLFEISIDSLLENEASNKKTAGQSNVSYTKRDKKIQSYISEKCTVNLKGWNDGVFDGYLIAQDKAFLYYLISEKEKETVGALAKDFITEIELCVKKDKYPVDLRQYQHINGDFFTTKRININLNDKHIWSGLIGKDTEYLNVRLSSLTNTHMIIEDDYELNDITISLDEVVKFEINC